MQNFDSIKVTKEQRTRRRRPIIRSSHFAGLTTKFLETGLQFDVSIGDGEREAACPEIGDGCDDADAFLEKIAALRGATKVVVHPPWRSAKRLLKIMTDAQNTHCPDEPINIGLQFPTSYPRRLDLDCNTQSCDEGQAVVMVAFDGKNPVGFANLTVVLSDWKDKCVSLTFALKLVYVKSPDRGKGFGLDLGIACGLLCSDILLATYRAAAAGTTITPTVTADYESKGGEMFSRQVISELEFDVDMLRQTGKRVSIVLDQVQREAGY